MIAKPRFIRRASQLTGDDSATARKIAIKQPADRLAELPEQVQHDRHADDHEHDAHDVPDGRHQGGIRPAGAASYSMKCFGSAPVPSRPGPVWADSTGPISLTIVGCDP